MKEEANDLITYEQLPLPLQALTPRTVERLARLNQLGPIRPIRFTPRGGVFFSRSAVLAFLESKLAAEAEPTP